MPGFFSRFGIIALLLLIAACGGRDAEVIEAPRDVAATAEPFLAALRNGKKAEAARYVVPAAQDELEAQFGPDHVRLARGPKLTARLIEKETFTANGRTAESATIVYGGMQNNRWTSATLRLVRAEKQGPFAVEYWRVTNNPPSLATGKAADEEVAQRARYAQLIFWGVIALFGLIVLGLLGWAWRNRSRPDGGSEETGRRPAATTTRD